MTLDQVINQQIANWNVLYTKLHRFHWYVKGPQFFTLHEKFEKMYEEAATLIDELAEQLLTNGGSPISSLREYLQFATIEECTEKLTAEEMVQTIIQDYSLLIDELKAGMEISENENDEVTSDLF